MGPVLTSCGNREDADESESHHVPVTDRALAVLAAEHLGVPARAQVEEDPYGLQHPLAAASVRYPVPSEDGDQVVVQVGTDLDPQLDTACEPVHPRGGCFTVDGAQVSWWEHIPQEDPGGIGIVAPRGDGVLVLVTYAGTAITGDPRDLELSVPLEGLISLAGDARIDRTTTQAAVEGGERIDYWTFG